MKVFSGKTANDVWLEAASVLSGSEAEVVAGRGGATRELLHAVFEIADPRQRWVFARQPAMNPAFALAEVVWIVLGRNDSAFLNFWNPSLSRFAGFDTTYHGAYGARLRRHFGVDQPRRVADALRANPASRQGVLQIWDSEADLPGSDGSPVAADVPCNVTSLLKVRNDRLDWLQLIRSNDIFLGTPHNFVQFMTLQEVMAGWIGVDVGTYVQVSDSLHVYQRDVEAVSGNRRGICETNTDQFVEPYDQSQMYFGAIGARMDEMRLDSCSSGRCVELASNLEAPESYRNLLLVVAADAARRHGGDAEADELMSTCSNPALSLMWRGWQKRCTERTRDDTRLKAAAPSGE